LAENKITNANGEITMKNDNEKLDSNERVESASRRSVLVGGGAATIAAVAAVAGGSTPAQAQTGREMEGKTAFVTGGARGIGLASADMLAQSGANIVLFDIAKNLPEVGYDLSSVQDLNNAKLQIETHGVECLTIQGDVRDRAALTNAVNETVSRFGSLDHVLVNAGITQAGPLEFLDDDLVQTVMDINVTGALRTIQAATPVMRKQKSGSIVVISSILGRQPNEWYAAYTASKWAVIGMAKSAALSLAGDGITCNVICPSLIDTPLSRSLIPAFSPENPTWEAVIEIMSAAHPLPKAVFEPEDVARMVKFFASDSAKFITGEVFNIDAGLGARGIS
jgi:NAD(P)-dependent dehydrogenase (short-subunit alcohol dehydrogenase family)